MDNMYSTTKKLVCQNLKRIAEECGSFVCHIEIKQIKKIKNFYVGQFKVYRNSMQMRKALTDFVSSLSPEARLFISNQSNTEKSRILGHKGTPISMSRVKLEIEDSIEDVWVIEW